MKIAGRESVQSTVSALPAPESVGPGRFSGQPSFTDIYHTSTISTEITHVKIE